MQQNLLLKKQNLHKIRDLMRAVRQSVTMIVNAGKQQKDPKTLQVLLKICKHFYYCFSMRLRDMQQKLCIRKTSEYIQFCYP